jgi:hypothetical protein
VGARPAELEHGQDVRFQGVAHHEKALRVDAVPRKKPAVGARVLFGNDFDVLEMFAKAGLRQLALLVAQVALGDEHQAVLRGQRGECFGDALEQRHWMGEHFAAELDERADFTGADPAAADFDGGFDGGKREALDAVAVELEIAHLGGEERAVDRGRVVVMGKQGAVALMRPLKNSLVVPEGVVGIKADGQVGNSHGGESAKAGKRVKRRQRNEAGWAYFFAWLRGWCFACWSSSREFSTAV